ncbi:MAG: hypothetical protein Phog2KO_38320 [Phototrophicaceae bacterium]
MFGFYILISMMIYYFTLSNNLINTHYNGKLVEQKLSSTTKDISGLENFLTERNFNFIATIENKYASQPAYHSFVFLSEHSNIVAQISHIDDDANSHLSLSTYWGNQNFVETQTSDPDDINIIPNVINNSQFIYSRLNETPEEVYRVHINNVKEMKETAGQPMVIQSSEMILTQEAKMLKIFSPILRLTILTKQANMIIKYSIFILVIELFFAGGILLFNSLPETEAISQLKSIAMAVFTIALLFFFVSAQNRSISEKNKPKNTLEESDIQK